MAGPEYDPEARPERAKLAMFGRIAFAVVCVSFALVAAMWLLFGGEDIGGPAPVISAEVGPDRVRPDPGTPSGQQVPHQNQQVFDVVTGDSGKSRQELLTDGSEQPMLVPGSTDGAQISARPAPANGSPIQLLPPKPLPLNIDPPAPRQPAQQQTPPPVVRSPPLIVVPSTTEAPPQQQRAAPPPQRPPLIGTPAPVVPAPAPVVAQPAPKPEPVQAAPKPQRRQFASLPPSDSYRIQIAAVRSNAAAQREWQRLRRQNKDILGSLQLFVQQVNIRNKSVYHRIQAGPLPDRILAEIACSNLKSRGVGCLIVAQ